MILLLSTEPSPPRLADRRVWSTGLARLSCAAVIAERIGDSSVYCHSKGALSVMGNLQTSVVFPY